MDVSEALVVDDLGDTERCERAFEAGTPVAVRASSAQEIKAALTRPEVVMRADPAGNAQICSSST